MVDPKRIVPLDPSGTAPPLFCVHAGSGSAYAYLELARLLGADQPVYGIEAPGFDDDREPVRSVPELSAEYARTLRELRPDGDLALLGWSVGGVIAFDLARRLSAAGTRVRRLVMVDVSVPVPDELPPEKEITSRFLKDILAGMGVAAPVFDRIIVGHPANANGDTIFRAAEASGALPDGLDAELLGERYAVFRAHIEASYNFAVTDPYNGPVSHLIAAQSGANGMRWGEFAPDLTEHIVPGDHYSIWAGDGLSRLAELVRAALSGTDRTSGAKISPNQSRHRRV